MRLFLVSTAALAALLATATVSNAGKFVPIVPVTGASSTNVFGINDSNDIAGSFISSNDGLEHGYVGPVDGSNYTTFDSKQGSTEPRAIANDGTIAGFSNNDGTPEDFIPFERFPDATLKPIKKKRKPLNYLAQGVSNTGDMVAGSYFDKNLNLRGYLAHNAKYKSEVTISISNLGVAPRAVDSAGDVVGWYYDSNGVQNGFLLSGGTASTVDYPDPNESSSVLEGINDSGIITGQWTDTSGVVHGFTYDMVGGTFTEIDAPNATVFTQAWGINSAGFVAIGSDAGYFIYCPSKRNCLQANGTQIAGKETHVALKDLPHVACVHGCLSPLNENDVHVPVMPTGATLVRHDSSARPQPLQP